MAIRGLGCTYKRSLVAHCPPAVEYSMFYFFTAYPPETTKIWNLLNLLSLSSWISTFFAIISVIIMLKCFTLVGTCLGCDTSLQEITLVPFQ